MAAITSMLASHFRTLRQDPLHVIYDTTVPSPVVRVVPDNGGPPIGWALNLFGLLAADGLGVAAETAVSATSADTATLAASATSALTAAKVKANVIVGGAAGDHTVSGMKATSTLVLVALLERDGTAANIDFSEITSECTAGVGKFNNTSGSDSTGDALLVIWLDT